MEPRENQVAQQLISQARQDWPIGVDEWEERARAVLSRGTFDWICGGAGEESTLRANRAAFERWRLRPRTLINTSERNSAIELFDTPSAAPFLLAPIGGQTVAHREGELAVARAAKSTGIPMLISQAASHSMEDIAAQSGPAPYWYQLFIVSDREVVLSLIRRAEACGCRALVVTVDTTIPGWRDRDLRNGYVPFLEDEGIRQYTTDPVFRSRLETSPEEDPKAAGAAMMQMFPNPSLTWDDLGWLREQTSLPVIVKGILRGEDAERALAAGMDAIIVSNHGGRQLDGVMAALDALPEVRDAAGPDAIVLVDGGIRRGTDVVKAVALGADAVLLGRPFIYGLAVGGQQGVEHVITTLRAEVDSAFALAGVTTVNDLDRSFVMSP
ncbi:MAG: alpha-hydroxy-acid oxidizing protein [Actinomycetota bacterium]